MAHIPDDLHYSRDHEWCRQDADGLITAGLTDFAQEQLGDIAHVELPEVGDHLEAGEQMGEIESSKAVADLPAPLSGTCVEVNSECRDNPAAINQDPYGEGWLVVIEPSDPVEFDSLMTPEEYEDFCAEEAERADL